MRHLLPVLFVVQLSLPCAGQGVYTKDGFYLGERDQLFTECLVLSKATMNRGDLIVDYVGYCNCLCDTLYPSLNSEEFLKIFEQEDQEGITEFENYYQLYTRCLMNHAKINYDFRYSDMEDKEFTKEFFIIGCLKYLSDSSLTGLVPEEKKEPICNCLVDKIFESGYTVGDVVDMFNYDDESPAFNEIMVPCILNHLNPYNDSRHGETYQPRDIIGTAGKVEVPLIDFMGAGLKVKISVAGIEKYFYLDTGASDLVINAELESLLRSAGALKIWNYLDETEYILADNHLVKARVALIDDVRIGDYTVNNVRVAILDEGNLLCGIGFLNKFKNWEIDYKNKKLILYR